MWHMNIKKIILNRIPPRFRFVLLDVKKRFLNDFGNIYYSQFGEDVLVGKLFKKKDGVYVDVGAHHPKRYSNTYLLHKRGWSGINIDPNGETVNMFNRDRPRDINIRAGVGKEKQELLYYSFSDPALNTFKESDAEKWLHKDWVILLSKEPVNIIPLKDILAAHAGAVSSIDVLNIDTEGMDLEVLESYDWSTTNPACIIVESPDFSCDSPHSNPIYSFLRGKGYALYAVAGPSLIFKEEKT